MKPYFQYGKKETTHLSKCDPVLGAYIKKTGRIQREIYPDLYAGILYIIISQLISVKAANSVWAKFESLCEPVICPEQVSTISQESLRSCGLSQQKTNSILHISNAFISKEMSEKVFNTLSEQQIREKLTAIKGIGLWTVEMVLIFCLQRPDVISYGDLIIRRGMMNLYGYDSLDKSTFEQHRLAYSPYATIASLYLWAAGSESQKYYVYILRCADDSLYTGWTNDIENRVLTHNSGKGAKYTKARLPATLVYTEELPTKSAALKREYSIKKLTKKQKLALI